MSLQALSRRLELAQQPPPTPSARIGSNDAVGSLGDPWCRAEPRRASAPSCLQARSPRLSRNQPPCVSKSVLKPSNHGDHRHHGRPSEPTAASTTHGANGGASADVGAIAHALERPTNNYLGPSQAVAPLELWQKDASVLPTPLCAASGNARRDQGLCCPACSPFLGALLQGTPGPAQGMRLTGTTNLQAMSPLRAAQLACSRD
jgi:hypothetical protein